MIGKLRPYGAHLSLISNLAYGFFTAVIGLFTPSWWFITLASYYIILGVMRFATLLCVKNPPESDTLLMRFTGGMFLFLSVTLAGTAYLSFLSDHGTRHHEITMITIALYSFVKITLAIVNLAKIKADATSMLKILRNISLADAAVSIFSLQRSMLVTFEGMNAGSIRLLNALTGSAVYLLVAILGLNLIGGKHIHMAKSKLIQANEKIAEAVTTGYKKIETGVVEGYIKIEDKFIDQFLTRDGETLEEAKTRLKGSK